MVMIKTESLKEWLQLRERGEESKRMHLASDASVDKRCCQ